MKFYLFTSDFDLIKNLEDIGFEGVLFTYNANGSDHLIDIAKKTSNNTKIKHMVAIRPYVISPQYLAMISQSINRISNNSFQVNLISGHIKDGEKGVGGIVGPVNDTSSSIERSKYLIEYVESLENLGIKIPDYYLSVTNQFTFDVAEKYKSKMIIPYSQYKNKAYAIDGARSMIAITPRLRETKEEINSLEASKEQHVADMATFTYAEFENIVDNIKKDKIERIILSAWNTEDTNYIISFVKQYKNKQLKKEIA